MGVKLKRENRTSGTIYLQVIFPKRKTLISTGIRVEERYWNQGLKKSHPNYRKLKLVLDRELLRAEEIFYDMVSNRSRSIDEFKRRYKGEEKPSLFQFWKSLSFESKKTESSYKESMNAFLEFGDVSFEEINMHYLTRAKQVFKKRGIKGVNYFKVLRSVYNKAIERGFVNRSNYPFGAGGFSVGSNSIVDKHIPLDTLNRIAKDHTVYCEWFLFMFMARGMEFVDLVKLESSNLKENRIEYQRAKTGKVISVLLTPRMIEIIKKHREGERLFPIHTTYSHARKVFNRSLKRYGATTKSAKHTYGFLLKEMSFDPYIIQQSLEHNQFSSTERYLAKSDLSKIDKAQIVLSKVIE